MPEEPERPHLRKPSPALRGLVVDMYGYGGARTPPSNTIEPARLIIALIFNFGAPYRIALGRSPGRHETWTSFVGGLHPGPVVIAGGADAECVQINLTPLGARRLLRQPMNAFASRLVALDDLPNPEIAAFGRRLSDIAGWDARLAAAERFLVARLAPADGDDPSLLWAEREIMARRGQLRIASLSERLGWSRRRLAEGFEREFGVSPKIFARMARFEAACKLATTAPRPDWAGLALDAGFADQSHLTREFAALAGTSPSRWRGAA